MSEFIQFFAGTDATLSDKLLEVLYIAVGLLSIYAGVRNALDRTNPKRVGTCVFWCVLGLLFAAGRWMDPVWVGVLIFVMVIPPIAGQVGKGDPDLPTDEEAERNYQTIGMKIFVPAFCIGIFALLFALFTQISSLVGLMVGALVGAALLWVFSKKNTPRVFLDDSRRMLDAIGPLSLLPMLLAGLGAVFTACGVGDVISQLVSGLIPEGNVVVGIVVYGIGMAVFTMVMGNAFGAITVMTVGIGAPFVLALGADPTIVGSVALTCGFCGTLMTPMAANFNIVPVALLEMKDDYGVIKKQIPIALVMLAVQIVYMILFAV